MPRTRTGRRVALAVALACTTPFGLISAGTATADSGDCRDWWTIRDLSRTTFDDANEAVTFWGHPSCAAPRTPQYWTALYRPDEPSDYGYRQMKQKYREGDAIAYGYELTKRSGGWVAVSFAASNG